MGACPDGAAALRFGLNAAAVSAAVALIAFAWSYAEVPAGIERKTYFEVLFWGGGHVLQFTWTLLMFAAWLWLTDAIGAGNLLSPRIAILLFAIALVSVFATPVIYLAYDVVSIEHYRLQTWLMRIGGGLAIVPFALAVLWSVVTGPRASAVTAPLKASLIWSLALFGAGGLIGLAISGSNVKIPAHYHGSIVGVTLAFMGLVYYLLPRMGFGRPRGRLAAPARAVRRRPAPAHRRPAVVRRLRRAAQGGGRRAVLRTTEQIAGMGLMGLGGLLAVAGGILFAVVVLRCLWTSSTSQS